MNENTFDRRTFLETAAAVTVTAGMAKNNEKQIPEKKTPLAEIHVHHDTSHTPSSILRVANKYNVEAFRGKTEEEVRRIIQAPAGCDWKTWYDHMKQTRRDYVSPEAIGELVEDILHDAQQNGVDLIELRVSLLSTVQALMENLGIKDESERWKYATPVLDKIIEAIQKCTGAIKADLVVSLSSQQKFKDVAADLLKLCRDYKEHIIGIDITNEKDLPPTTFSKEIEKTRQDIKFLTIHCMEVMDPERGWDALKLNPDRIGHGIRAVEDPRLVDKLAELKIPLEMCVHSNLVSGATTDIAKHPMKRLDQAGVILTVGSDGCNDGSTLADNYALIQKSFGFTDADMNRFRNNSWKNAFRNLHK